MEAKEDEEAKISCTVHEQKQSSEPSVILECDWCVHYAVNPTVDSLLKHVLRKHSIRVRDSKPFVASLCLKQYPRVLIAQHWRAVYLLVISCITQLTKGTILGAYGKHVPANPTPQREIRYFAPPILLSDALRYDGIEEFDLRSSVNSAYACTACGRVFASSDTYARHWRDYAKRAFKEGHYLSAKTPSADVVKHYVKQK